MSKGVPASSRGSTRSSLNVNAVKAKTATRVSFFGEKSGEIPWKFLKTGKTDRV